MAQHVDSSSTPSFRPLNRSKLSQSIVAEILESLRSGAYQQGESLPPERVLAEQFAVGRGSVREALRVLEYAGIVEIRVGSGITFTGQAQTKSAMMRAQAALVGDHSPLDILVARMAIEPTCANIAATAALQADITKLEQTIAEQRDLTVRGENPSEPDALFHITIAESTHNDIMMGMATQVLALTREGTWAELKAKTRSDEDSALEFLDHHQEVLHAIKARDGDAAEDAMRRHLKVIEARFLEK